MAPVSPNLRVLQQTTPASASTSANVKSLIKRFEFLASYSSVPNVRSSFLNGTSLQRRPYTQQAHYSQQTTLNPSNIRKDLLDQIQVDSQRPGQLEQEEEGVLQERQTQRQLTRISSEVGPMSLSGYLGLSGILPQNIRSGEQLSPISLAKPRSSFNNLTPQESLVLKMSSNNVKTSYESVAEVGQDARDGGSIQCTSASRLALRRLGQSVKRKASFFIEQSQKQEDLPIRKSPPPKRLFGADGENMGRKVSKKVMDKVATVRRVNAEENRGMIVQEEWRRERENRSSGDGAADNTSFAAGVERLTTGTDESTGTSQKSEGTEASSSWSSAGYFLIAPVTPPVLKNMPSQFIHNLLRRSLKQSVARADPQVDKDEQLAYKGSPGEILENGQDPGLPNRYNDPTKTLLTGGCPKAVSNAQQGLMKNQKLRKAWRNWVRSSSKGVDGSGDAGELDEMKRNGTARKIGITPPKVSVKSLIAKFRQAESDGHIRKGEIEHQVSSRRESYNSVEVQFSEETGNDHQRGQAVKAVRGRNKESLTNKLRRSISIRTSIRSPSDAGEPMRAQSAIYTFVSEQIVDVVEHFRTPSRQSPKQPKPYELHSGNGRRSFRLKIALQNEEVGDIDGKEESAGLKHYDDRRNRKQRSIGTMSRSPNCPNRDAESRRDSNEYSGTDCSPPSLTSTDTIVTTKISSGSQRHSYTYTSDDERYLTQEGDETNESVTALNEQRWSGNSDEYADGSLSGSEGGMWDESSKQRDVFPEGALDVSTPVEQRPRQMIRPVYTYQAYQDPIPLQPMIMHHVNVQGQYSGATGVGGLGEGYRRTPAPEGFVMWRRTSGEGIEQEGNQRNGMGDDRLLEEERLDEDSDEYDSVETGDKLGYVYINDDETEGEKPYEVLSNNTSERGDDGDIEGEGAEDVDEFGGEYELHEDALRPTMVPPGPLTSHQTSLRGGMNTREHELTPPLVNYTNTTSNHRHHKRRLISTSPHVNKILRPVRSVHEDDSGPYPTARTASAARRLSRQHEAASMIVSTVLFDGVDMLEELDGVEVIGMGNVETSERMGMGELLRDKWEKEREWEELMEEEENVDKVKVKLPVRGVPVCGRLLQPKPRNLVLRGEIERFVSAWG